MDKRPGKHPFSLTTGVCAPFGVWFAATFSPFRVDSFVQLRVLSQVNDTAKFERHDCTGTASVAALVASQQAREKPLALLLFTKSRQQCRNSETPPPHTHTQNIIKLHNNTVACFLYPCGTYCCKCLFVNCLTIMLR